MILWHVHVYKRLVAACCIGSETFQLALAIVVHLDLWWDHAEATWVMIWMVLRSAFSSGHHGTEPAENFTFFSGEGRESQDSAPQFTIHKHFLSVSDIILHIVLRVHWRDVALNVHSQTEGKGDGMKRR
jgi:hypothetical protein